MKADILNCNLSPGAHASEAQLAKQYPWGRAAIRTAMHRLYQEGLVQPIPRQGYIIAPIAAQDVMDLFDLRLLLEPAAARRAVGNINKGQLEELDRLCNVGYNPDDPASVSAFQKANTEFHLLVAHAAGNQRLTRCLASLLEEMQRLYHLGLTLPHAEHSEPGQGHLRLVQALVAGNPDLAETVSREQVTESRRIALDRLLSLPSLRSVNLSALPSL